MAERIGEFIVHSSQFTENFNIDKHTPAYNPAFDIEDKIRLEDLKHQVTESDFLRLKLQFERRTRHNLKTCLAERFNVQVSEVYYGLIDGRLHSEEHDEPFIDIVKRGVDYRKLRGNPFDHLREQAELEGFAKVQEILNKTHIIPGFNVISISPRGSENSDYRHNFFDIWEVVDAGQIRMSRFASKMDYQEFLSAACRISPSLESPKVLNDSFFLKNPIETFRSYEEILAVFHPDKDAMSQKHYQDLINNCSQLINHYIDCPSEKTFNALLNLADHLVDQNNHIRGLTPRQLIDRFGAIPVRSVFAGCGLSQGFSQVTSYRLQVTGYPYSVAEFGFLSPLRSSNENTSDFKCPGHKKDGTKCTYIVRYGSGIRKCPECGQEATCG